MPLGDLGLDFTSAQAVGDYSSILGGDSNTVLGTSSVVLGSNSTATHDYSSVLGFNGCVLCPLQLDSKFCCELSSFFSAAHLLLVGSFDRPTATCESQGDQTVTICAPAGMFVNGVDLVQRVEDLSAQASF